MIGLLIYGLMSIICGIALCFYGKRIFFILGPICITSVFVQIIANSMGINIKSIIIILSIFIISFLLFKLLLKVGIFLFGGIVGATSALCITRFIPDNNIIYDYRLIIIIAVIIIVGILAVLFGDMFIMLSTAYEGAKDITSIILFIILKINNFSDFVYIDGTASTISHMSEYINVYFINENYILLVGTSILLAVFGFLYQKRNDK